MYRHNNNNMLIITPVGGQIDLKAVSLHGGWVKMTVWSGQTALLCREEMVKTTYSAFQRKVSPPQKKIWVQSTRPVVSCIYIHPQKLRWLRFPHRLFNRRFAKPRPLLKCYGNQPSAILNGASVNNHDSAVYKFGGDSSSNRAVYVNNRLWNCLSLQD